jgi:hypothetical protein
VLITVPVITVQLGVLARWTTVRLRARRAGLSLREIEHAEALAELARFMLHLAATAPSPPPPSTSRAEDTQGMTELSRLLADLIEQDPPELGLSRPQGPSARRPTAG